MNLPNIALVGKAKDEDIDILNSILDEEGLTELCDVTLYGADDQPEDEALEDAIHDCQDNAVQGIVCLPLQCSVQKGLTRTLCEEAGKALPIMINSVMRMAPCKNEGSITEVAGSLTKEDVIDSVTRLEKALQNDFMILKPRIAVLSLNKAIDTGDGSVELNIIAPAISELVNNGIQVFGPIAAGTFFESFDYQAYDAVLCMYQGQCKDAFKKASNEETITIVSGIDIPLAIADPTGILKAFYTVTDMAHNRIEYKRPFRNPLQKLFHEHREDGEKARFVAKKKGFNPAEHRRENVTFTTIRTPKNDEGENGNVDTDKSTDKSTNVE